MIHYVKISNFGPVQKEIELNFEATGEEGSPVYEVEMPDGRKLLKLAYIYGPNASGKTTVLRAIDFLRRLWLEPLYNKDHELDYDPFLFKPDPQQSPSTIEVAFYANDMRYVYRVTFFKRSVQTEKLVVYRTNQPTELFSRTTDLEKRLSYVDFGTAVKGAAGALAALATATLHNNTVLGAFQKINVDLPDLEQLNRWSKDFFSQMINAQTNLSDYTAYKISQDTTFANWMNIFLNKADPNLKGVSVKVEKSQSTEGFVERMLLSRPDANAQEDLIRAVVMEKQINFLHSLAGNEVYALPLAKESSGSIRYFGLGSVLYRLLTQPSFAGIDELDTSLHVDLMKYFLQVFLLNSGQSQLVFTSHNIFLLEEKDLIRKDALWFTEKGKDGQVSLYSAIDFDSATLRKGASLINAYKSGRLGAKPNLGSPYLTSE
jgi:AAA15 family ATPase/GTPase